MTKEAKLQAAMRILPEWVGYDEEIKALQQKIENENRQTEKEEGKLRKIIESFKGFTCSYYTFHSLFSEHSGPDSDRHEEL